MPRTPRAAAGPLVLALALAAVTGCAASRNVRPVGEGKVAAGLSVGGPFFTNLGAPYPTPLASAYVRYGLDAKTDLDASVHVPIVGNLGVDVGAARLLREQQGLTPAVMAGARVALHGNLLAIGGENPNGRAYSAGVRVFEEAYANASWRVGEASLAWVGLDLFAQAEALKVLPSLVAGAEWRAAKAFGLTVELQHLAFLTNQRFAAVDFVGPADRGALSLKLGFNFYPGSDR